MEFFLKLIPDSLKLPAIFAGGLVVGAALMFYPAKWVGASSERQAIELKSAKEALERIQNLEKNNASFTNLSDRDRCLVFMRDSKLPDSACN